MTTPRHGIPWRIAFISDPHGDHVALSKVISDLETGEPVDEALVGGDLAQGGAQPAVGIDEIRQRGWPTVLANHHHVLYRGPNSTPHSPTLRNNPPPRA